VNHENPVSAGLSGGDRDLPGHDPGRGLGKNDFFGEDGASQVSGQVEVATGDVNGLFHGDARVRVRAEMGGKPAVHPLHPAVFEKVDLDLRTFDGNSIAQLLKGYVMPGGTLGSPGKGEVREIALQGEEAVLLLQEVPGDAVRFFRIFFAQRTPELDRCPRRSGPNDINAAVAAGSESLGGRKGSRVNSGGFAFPRC